MSSSHKPFAKAPVPDGQTIAIAALSHFATNSRTLDRFFAVTGLDPASLREAAATEGFVAGVLDFVLSDEALTVAVAHEQDIAPEAIAAARQRLDRPVVDDDWPPRGADDWA